MCHVCLLRRLNPASCFEVALEQGMDLMQTGIETAVSAVGDAVLEKVTRRVGFKWNIVELGSDKGKWVQTSQMVCARVCAVAGGGEGCQGGWVWQVQLLRQPSVQCDAPVWRYCLRQ